MTDRDNAGEQDTHKQLHEQMRKRLADYATAEALGQEPSEVYPDVADYLDEHSELRDELDELRALILPAYTNDVEPAPTYPEPDLSFLEANTETSDVDQVWHWKEEGQLLIHLTEALLDVLRPPSFAGATRGQLLYSYDVALTGERDIDVQIEIFSEDATEEAVTVCVTVDVQYAEPLSQAGSRVALRTDETTWTGETDEAGYVEFSGIPRAAIANLHIEVTPIEDD